MYLFEGLRQKVLEYLPAEQVEQITAAYRLAADAHNTQKRHSGEPYITHPVAVAGILLLLMRLLALLILLLVLLLLLFFLTLAFPNASGVLLSSQLLLSETVFGILVPAVFHL